MRYEKYIEDSINKNYMHLEITYRCRLECPLCMRQTDFGKSLIKQYRDMPLEDFKKILEFSTNMQFCGNVSDPIYHPKFLDILNLFAERDRGELLVNTNGSGKRVEWWEKAFSHSKRIAWLFGLDGTTQESANKYRVHTNFNSVFNAMILGKEMGCRIGWQMIKFPYNEGEIEHYKDLCKTYGIETYIKESQMKKEAKKLK